MKTVKKDKGNISVICDLDLQRYLGNWYEIGRLPLRSEKGLDNITAIYNLKKNGEIEVINGGYKNSKKKSIRGSAWLADEDCTGALYVRFFWPFKSEYNVIKLDKDYRYAVVMGETKDNMWILSRSPKMESKVYGEIIDFLSEKGFNIKKIINPIQDKS